MGRFNPTLYQLEAKHRFNRVMQIPDFRLRNLEITRLPREEVFWLDSKIVPITRIMEAAGLMRG